MSAVLDLPPIPTHPVAFRFEWSDDAARHNLTILRTFRLDLAAALAAQPFSTITPGSEFRPAHLLAPLLSHHPLWPRFRERITLGAEFPLTSIADTDRRADLQAILSRGNHKSARGHEAKLTVMLKEEVSRGWQLPALPKEAALELPGCEVAPLGVVPQMTIDENGKRQPKLRLTHDQSFNPIPGERRSVNRVVMAELTPARFGRALMQLLHYICLLRRRFPGERLLLTKVDCKSAYRRIHLQATTAMKACIVFAGLLLVALRLTFGGAPNPSQWSDVSEVAVDLANDLVRRDVWDPSVWSVPQHHLLESDKAVDCDAGTVRDDDTFGDAAEMSVVYPDEDARPRFDCYLDDLFGVSSEADRARLEAVLPFVLHLIGRPVEDGVDESLPRDALLGVSKFLAEARASESKVILGWVVITRSMMVSLPQDKHRAWTDEIRTLMSRPGRRTTAKELESTIGRLIHAACEGWPCNAGGDPETRPGRQASTIRAALDGVAQAFRANQLGSPIHDSRGRFDTVLAAQLRGYAMADPETRQSQAITAPSLRLWTPRGDQRPTVRSASLSSEHSSLRCGHASSQTSAFRAGRESSQSGTSSSGRIDKESTMTTWMRWRLPIRSPSPSGHRRTERKGRQ